jgi:hypothetical protein
MHLTRHMAVGLAVALSAFVALAVTYRAPMAPAYSTGDVPAGLIEAEHALIADYVRMDAETRLAADRAADHELARSYAEAAEQAANRYTALAPEPSTRAAKAMKTASVAAPLSMPSVALPLQLVQVTEPPAAPRRPVIARVVSTVERIPTWVRSGVENAAAWVADLPAQALPRLPERRFL